jgi:ABC-type amino acid transport substrate-binding protein
MKRRSICAALITSVVTSTAWAGSFTVGVEATDYLPISKGDAGGYSGYAREVLDAFASKYGHTFTYKPMPVARLFDEFAVQKSLDFKFPDNAYWGGDAKKGVSIVYSKGLVSVTEGLMVLPENKAKTSVTKIVTIRGFTPYPYLDQINAKKIAVSEVNAPEAALNMVEAGRVDGVYMGQLTATYILAEVMKKPGVLVFGDKLPNSKNDFSLSTIARPEVIKQMDEFLVKEKDTVAKIKAKYKITE